MDTDEETIDEIVESWGSEESKGALLNLLNAGAYEGDNIEDALCDGNCVGASFDKVESIGDDFDHYTAVVSIHFTEVIHQQCKDTNDRFPRTGSAKVTIWKDGQMVFVSDAIEDPKPNGDIY
jgi:hypothetical protein